MSSQIVYTNAFKNTCILSRMIKNYNRPYPIFYALNFGFEFLEKFIEFLKCREGILSTFSISATVAVNK